MAPRTRQPREPAEGPSVQSATRALRHLDSTASTNLSTRFVLPYLLSTKHEEVSNHEAGTAEAEPAIVTPPAPQPEAQQAPSAGEPASLQRCSGEDGEPWGSQTDGDDVVARSPSWGVRQSPGRMMAAHTLADLHRQAAPPPAPASASGAAQGSGGRAKTKRGAGAKSDAAAPQADTSGASGSGQRVAAAMLGGLPPLPRHASAKHKAKEPPPPCDATRPPKRHTREPPAPAAGGAATATAPAHLPKPAGAEPAESDRGGTGTPPGQAPRSGGARSHGADVSATVAAESFPADMEVPALTARWSGTVKHKMGDSVTELLYATLLLPAHLADRMPPALYISSLAHRATARSAQAGRCHLVRCRLDFLTEQQAAKLHMLLASELVATCQLQHAALTLVPYLGPDSSLRLGGYMHEDGG